MPGDPGHSRWSAKQPGRPQPSGANRRHSRRQVAAATRPGECGSVAADFDDALPLLQLANNLGPERFEPREESAVGAVADAKPNNPRAVFATDRTFDDVIVFGHNDPIALGREIHNAPVVGVA